MHDAPPHPTRGATAHGHPHIHPHILEYGAATVGSVWPDDRTTPHRPCRTLADGTRPVRVPGGLRDGEQPQLPYDRREQQRAEC
eukprot:6550135-Prymnesium_polylepis.1